MQLIRRLDDITTPFKNAVITIGNFDGVHIGHQALFYEVIERAHAVGGTSMAMTFEPHPLRVLKKNHTPPLITLFEQKAELIERSGLDVLICAPFTLEFASISARSFVEVVMRPSSGKVRESSESLRRAAQAVQMDEQVAFEVAQSLAPQTEQPVALVSGPLPSPEAFLALEPATGSPRVQFVSRLRWPARRMSCRSRNWRWRLQTRWR